jgi:hypothetical protein
LIETISQLFGEVSHLEAFVDELPRESAPLEENNNSFFFININI